MNKKQERNLDVLSGIDESIVEWSSQKRAVLKNSRKSKAPKKKWYIMGGSIAAALLLILGTVLLMVNLMTKQVPVYTGMTVAGTPQEVAYGEGTVSMLSFNAPNGNAYGYKGDIYRTPEEAANDKFNKPVEDVLTVVGGGEELYYATPGAEIYVTVHLSNPDEFEIQSFTLNGTKYANYMFEDGSDLENLILKVEVPEGAEGRISYTIDAIKYIDGTEIKDVRMDGDKTVEVGVSTSKQPAATVSGESVGYDAVSFKLTAADELGLVGASGGRVQVVLYNGQSILSFKDVATVGETEITFEGLDRNTHYSYAVVANYDALDGKGYTTHVLLEKSFYTKNYVLFQNVSVSESGVSFDYLWDAAATNATVTSLKLYQGGAVVQTPEAASTSITGLVNNTEYRLVATYMQGGEEQSIELTFVTAKTYTVKLYSGTQGGDTRYLPAGATLPTVERAGHTFTGWVDAEGNSYSTVPDKDIVLHAVFLEETSVAKLTYTVEAESVTVTGLRDTSLTALVLPAYIEGKPVKKIGDFAFKDGTALTDIRFAATSSLEIVGYYAFTRTRIETITLPETVTELWGGAFCETALREIVIPANVYHFGSEMFSWCPNLEKVTINAVDFDCRYGDVHDGYGASSMQVFYSAGGEAGIELIFGEGVTAIPEDFCRSNDALRKVTIPASVTSIGAEAFLHSGLTEINFNATAMSDITFDSNTGRYGAIFDGVANATLNIGANVTRIPVGLFEYSGVKTVNFLGTSVCTEIGSCAFQNCTVLTSISIPASVKSIGQYAFNFCSGLSSVAFAENGVWTINAQDVNVLASETAQNAGFLKNTYAHYAWTWKSAYTPA